MHVSVWSFSPSSLILSRTEPDRRFQLQTTSNDDDYDNDRLKGLSFFDGVDQELLNERLIDIRRQVFEMELSRPPTKTDLSPTETVQTILDALLHPYDPLPDSGFRLLLNTATSRWKKEILKSVGASPTSDPEIVASALGSSIGRPHNKYAILISNDESPPSIDDDAQERRQQQQYSSSSSSPEYDVRYADPLDFDDGTCWVECTLRDPSTGKMLVMTGWDLRQRQADGAWLVDSIHWQDFREEFLSQNKIEYLVA
jgi:hypothetical protein